MNLKKLKWPLLILVLGSIGFFSFRAQELGKIEAELGVERDNKLLEYFQEVYPDRRVLKCGYEDLDDDGRKDLVVIFYKEKRSNGMVVVLDKEDGYKLTDELPAPIDNQSIEFKNIDDEGPIEFIVSGSKDGRYGYAIFRLEGLELKDLFGEGMEDCC